jgi:WD40 repeat protein
MAADPATHPPADTLQAYGLGQLDGAAADEVRRHLDGCPDCRRNYDSRPAGYDSAAAGAPPPDVPPELRDHPDYEVVRELGRGGMGVVYLARNRRLERPEVLKVISRHLLSEPGAVQRFLREMRSAARLSHKNIVTAYAAPQAGDLLVFAMEYVEGEDLDRMVRRQGPLPVGNACLFAHQVALGLAHAHDKGMIHRDIKPHNLILTHDGKKPRVKILDFGLARATREGDGTGLHLTGVGMMLGTPAYMAPEQMRDAARADIRADLYSLGCTLYFLLSGRPPFQADSLFEVLQAHVETDARPLDRVRADVPAELARVVAKLMAKDPAQRYQTPAEAAQALAPFARAGLRAAPVAPAPADGVMVLEPASAAANKTKADGGSKHDTPAGPAPVLRPTVFEGRPAAPAERKKRAAAPPARTAPTGLLVGAGLLAAGGLLVAGVLVLVCLVGVFWGKAKPAQPDRADDPPPVAAAPKPDDQPVAAAPKPNDGPVVAVPPKKPDDQPPPAPAEVAVGEYDLTGGFRFVAFGPGGPRVVLLFNDLKQKQHFARLYDLSTGQPLAPSLQHSGSVAHAAFSPDGKRLVTASSDKTARVWDAASGQPVTPPLAHTAAVTRATFSPDGKRVVTTSFDKTARVWDASTGQPLTPPLQHEGWVTYATFNPDGKSVVTASLDKTARVWDASTGQPLTPPLGHGSSVMYATFSPGGKRVVTASSDKTARVWDAATGQALTPPLAHGGSVAHAVFSPDGKRVVTASSDKTAQVWDAATGQAVCPPLRHDNGVLRATFSADGKRVVTASSDKTARVWDAATGQPLAPPFSEDGSIWYAAFNPDGKWLVTVSGKTARLWDAATGQEQKRVAVAPDAGALPRPEQPPRPPAIADAVPPGWVTFRSDEGNYTVAMPENPTPLKQPLPQGGPMTLHTAKMAEKQLGFVATSHPIPPGELTNANTDEVFRGFVLGLTSKGGKILKEAPVNLGPHQGREYVVEIPPPPGGVRTTSHMRVYLAGSRLILLMVGGPAVTLTPPQEAAPFFNSLKIGG